MNDLRTLFEYANWAIIIGLTLGFFQYFSVKFQKFSFLFPLVIIPVWLIIAFILGIEYLYRENINYLNSIGGYIGLLAETLAITIVFGGLTFAVKYKKLWKAKSYLKNK